MLTAPSCWYCIFNDIYEIPIDAIREAIVNAIIHRDYTMNGTNIQIEVLADRVEVSNPGGLPDGLSCSMLGKKSIRRNELLADLFHRMDKSERIGSGIPRIASLLKAAKLKPAKFESNTFFTVTFKRPEEYRSVQTVPGKTSQEKFPEKLPRNSAEVHKKLSISSVRILRLPLEKWRKKLESVTAPSSTTFQL